MMQADTAIDKLLASLQERAKELNCLYEVEQVLNQSGLPLAEAFQAVVEAIPPGWQYPDVCRAMIEHGGNRYVCGEVELTEWVQSADIVVQDQVVGRVVVCYLEERPREAIGPFLREEERLIRTIAERLAHFILFQQLHEMRTQWEDASRQTAPETVDTWRGPLTLLRRSDKDLYLRIARKMLNYLCWIGVDAAQQLLQESYGRTDPSEAVVGETNAPGRVRGLDPARLLSGEPFDLASQILNDEEILNLIQHWILEDKISFFPKVLHDARSSLPEIAESLRRFHHAIADGVELAESTLNGIRVSLIRRFLTDHLEFINIAKQYLETSDFADLLERVIFVSESQGKLGGKSAGLLLAAKILARRASAERPVGEVRVPKSWYISSDAIMGFIMYNELEEVLQQKYREISEVRQEYQNIIQLFKGSRFPPDIVKGVSMALDDFGEVPLIVRSSSLLEDRLGSAFSGKYKSLFLPNTGSKKERLAALLDAITEVYASIFGPDPIAYRRERGLLDFHEEMAILIQEVVGTRVGRYFLPAAAGVAFSNNELSWSPRIRRKDGLLRLVPGLGTRAVDRISDDYPILAAPGQPGLRVNASVDEVIRYSPRKADVINLDTGDFETVLLSQLLTECGTAYPGFDKTFSLVSDGVLQRAVPLLVDVSRDQLVANFAGLIDSTPFVRNVRNMLQILEQSMGTPVDIEFAFDGTHFFLLQCRPQSYSEEEAPAPIPRDLPAEDVLFTASRHISNGRVPDLSHIVYVDPDGYGRLSKRSELMAVGQAVSRLNKMLPKRRFILMGPGRWGSRGDIKMGVSVTYSDINSTAMLVEIAKQRGGYLPDLSFGTHFFQDLVEASIRYLPIYLDSAGGTLDERFLLRAPNLLASMLPDLAWLQDVVRVIDVPSSAGGRVLRVLMNSELGEAVGIFTSPDVGQEISRPTTGAAAHKHHDELWRWRYQMAEKIASELDPERFGVRAMYLIGSTKNANAGPASDIDLIIHVEGIHVEGIHVEGIEGVGTGPADEQQREKHQALMSWLEGWSLCLAEVNYLRTGYRSDGLLDIHLVTDEDIERRTSFAAKIGAVTDAARKLTLGTAAGSGSPGETESS